MSIVHAHSGLTHPTQRSSSPASSGTGARQLKLEIAVVSDPVEIAGEWLALQQAGPTSAFQSNTWATLWSTHIANTDTCRPVIVTGRDGRGDLQMVLPLALHNHGPLTELTWLGVHHGSHFAGLFASDLLNRLDPAATEALWAAILPVLPRADYLALIDQPATIGDCPNPLLGATARRSVDSTHLLALEDGATMYRHGRIRRSIARWRRRLNELGTVEYAAPRDAASRTVLLDELCAQKNDSLEQKGIRSFLREPRFADFYRALADPETVGMQEGHIAGLRLDGALVAACVGLIHQRTYHGLILSTSDDRAIRPTAPGHLLIDQVIRELSAAGVTRFNLGTGQSLFKHLWCNRELLLFDNLYPLTWRGQWAVRVIAACRALKRMIKQNPRTFAWFARLRGYRGRIWALLRRRITH